MNWTTEYPTQPGYYWLKNYTINCYPNKPQWNEMEPQPTVVELDADLSFNFIGYESVYYQNELVSAEWFGPIQPPQENDK